MNSKPLRIYLARAVDGRTQQSIDEVAQRVRQYLQPPRFEIVDPLDVYHPAERDDYVRIVDTELALLSSCNLLLLDMSLPDHAYIGCVAELVYARLLHLRTCVYIGARPNLSDRPWLRYHADHIDSNWNGIIKWFQAMTR